jgi:hypothetical protein
MSRDVASELDQLNGMQQEEGPRAWRHQGARYVVGCPSGEREDTAIRMLDNQLDQVLDPVHLSYR